MNSASMPQPLLAHQVQHHTARLRGTPVLEDVNSLPRAEQRPAFRHRDRQVRLRQRRARMRRHVIRAFQGVLVNRGVLRHQPRQEALQVGPYRRVLIFLDQQAGRGVADIQGKQPLPDAAGPHPGPHLRREGI